MAAFEYIVAEFLADNEPRILASEPQLGMANARAENFAQGAGREGKPIYIFKAIRHVTCQRKAELQYEDVD